MTLLNYTTKISVEKTLFEIQKELSSHGATAVLSEFDSDGNVIALSFKVLMDGQEAGFKLPCDWRPVQQLLKNSRKASGSEEQARRTAWRIVKDWVEAQMAIVETKMVTTDQVFLPYAIAKNGQTVYELIKESKLMLLGNGTGE